MDGVSWDANFNILNSGTYNLTTGETTHEKLTLFLVGFLLLAFGSFNSALAQVEKVEIRVDGLACPFCAYGLEKKLKKIEGVEKVQINVKDGIATLRSKKGKSVEFENLESVVKDAGFTPREITATVVGKVGQSDGTLVFSVTGSDGMFIINDNAEFQKLTSALKGSEKRVRITGRLAHDTQEGHQAHPYTLTLEKFEVI